MLTRHVDGSEIACNYATSFQLCDVCGDAVYLWESEQSVSTDAEERLIDVSVGQAILSRERNLGLQLLHLLTKFNSLCIVCFVAGKSKISHQSVGCCPTMTGLCLRCFQLLEALDAKHLRKLPSTPIRALLLINLIL